MNSRGFTVIELLIATSVFSLVLLVVSLGLIEIGRVYTKGINLSKTQESLRTVVSDVSRSIQFSGSMPFTSLQNNGWFGLCAGSRQFSYKLGSMVADNPVNHAIVASNISANCAQAQDLDANFSGSELLGEDMRLAKFDVYQPDVVANPNLWYIAVRVVRGSDDLLCSPSHDGDCESLSTSTFLYENDITCKSNRSGSQFCAVAEMSTTVLRRL